MKSPLGKKQRSIAVSPPKSNDRSRTFLQRLFSSPGKTTDRNNHDHCGDHASSSSNSIRHDNNNNNNNNKNNDDDDDTDHVIVETVLEGNEEHIEALYNHDKHLTVDTSFGKGCIDDANDDNDGEFRIHSTINNNNKKNNDDDTDHVIVETVLEGNEEHIEALYNHDKHLTVDTSFGKGCIDDAVDDDDGEFRIHSTIDDTVRPKIITPIEEQDDFSNWQSQTKKTISTGVAAVIAEAEAVAAATTAPFGNIDDYEINDSDTLNEINATTFYPSPKCKSSRKKVGRD